MLSFKKILCPIDFSPASLDGLKTASEMALKFSAELLVLHVRPITVLPPEMLAVRGFDFAVYEQQQGEDMGNKLEEVASRFVPGTITRRVLLQMGDAGHEILEMAKTEAVDLIVIATHGMTGWRHYLYGSVTQRVLHHTPCSVLVVHSASPRNK